MKEMKMPKPSESLEQRLGFNPNRRQPITQDVLTKVLSKVREKRLAEAETRAEGIVTQVLDLVEKHEKTKREFLKADEAFEKTVGKLLAQLNAGLSGQPVPEETEGAETSDKAGQ
jgi:hypothetical protein